MAEYLELSEDVQQIQKWVHDFSESVIRPAAAEYDEKEATPWEIVAEAAKIGLYSMEFFANAQITDPTGLMMPVTIEELFWGDSGIGLSIMGTGLAVAALAGNGTPDQLMEWAPQMFGTPEKPALGAFGVSEPDAGSDVSSLRSRAVYDEANDEWVLNGTKAWITNGGIADVHVLVLSVDPALGARGQASFVIPKGAKGFSQGQKYSKHGIRASHTAELVLDDVRVPGRNLLGGKEKLEARLAKAREGASTGVQAAMSTFETTRPSVGAMAVGCARAAYEYSLEYAKERVQFGRPIIDNQGIAFKLADMKTRIDAARLLIWRAAWMARHGHRLSQGEGSSSKLFASETATWATEEAIQILGGNGYTREYPVERWHRDSKIFTIFEGTSEVQRLVIARAIANRREIGRWD